MVLLVMASSKLHELFSDSIDLFAPSSPLATGISNDPNSLNDCLHCLLLLLLPETKFFANSFRP